MDFGPDGALYVSDYGLDDRSGLTLAESYARLPEGELALRPVAAWSGFAHSALAFAQIRLPGQAERLAWLAAAAPGQTPDIHYVPTLDPVVDLMLQTAAVIGHEVPLALLQTIADCSEEALHRSLTQLQGAEFLYQSRFLPQAQYTFKHALTHQVAYESLLKERRRAIHLQLVTISEALYADRLDEHVERLAHHAVASEQWTKAVDYLYRSANRAAQRSAHQAAIQFLNKGLEIIATLPESRERLRQELDYRKAMGVTMMAAKGWAAKEVLDAYTRARVLCEELGDERETFIVLRGEGQYRMIRGESQIARSLGDRCVELAAGSKDMGVHIETHHLFWANSFFMGEYADADFHCAKGISLYRRSRDHALTYVYSGHDPGVCGRSFSLSARQTGGEGRGEVGAAT
jgi:hypothetical protein